MIRLFGQFARCEMECNKEQALHAKEIALRKLKTKDFLGAQRIALKAQRLYPKLENLSQLLTICEVHCAAEVKVNGHMDWYGILKVEATADETIIRKEYQKLAFLLHPGKNSLPSAQAAFKLVSEAHTILCDHVKRSQYDIKRQCDPQQMSKETTWPSDEACANKSGVVEQIPPSDCVTVFWTICPHCRKRFVYHRRNFLICCDVCSRNFFAFNLQEEVVPSRFLAAAPNNSQVSSEMFAHQKHGTHNPQFRYSKLHTTGGDLDYEPMMHARHRDSDGEGSCSETRGGVVECLATNVIHSPAHSLNKCTTRRMMPDPLEPHLVATQNLSRDDAATVLNTAGSDSLERSGKRKQDDGVDNSHSRDSCNSKRVKKYNSLPDADSGGDKISSDNVTGADNQSAENLPSRVDNRGDRNAAHEDNANYSNDKMFNDNIAGVDSQSAKHSPSKVDSQGDGNVTHKCKSNNNDDEMFNDRVARAGNLSTEHLHSKVGSQGDGNATLEYGVNSSDAQICNSNVATSNNESAEDLPREMENQGDGNATYDGPSTSGDFKSLNDSLASAGNRSTEYLSSKVDIQRDGNATCESNVNCGSGKMFNDITSGFNNQSSEHNHREMDSQGYGNATHKCIANSDTVNDQANINSEATDTVGEKSCYSRSSPDPNIFDFEKFRDVTCFAVGQIWAVYDNLDGMPRFYARIMQLDASDFKVHLAWLEHDAVNEEEDKWTDEELPIACGNFFIRKTIDISRNRSMFSHIIPWTEGKERNSYVIHPIKGEVWALYKGWSMEWILDADNHRSYEYEVVELLSNISTDGGATVIPLVRIKGFVSLFAIVRDKPSFTIPSSELLRFSHRIPFYRTTGNEKAGVPGGFLALDTACLPTDLDAAFPSVPLDMALSKMDPGTEHILEKNQCEAHFPMTSHNDLTSEHDISSQKNSYGSNEFGDTAQQSCLLPNTYYTYPASDFHNFEELRSHDKFESGQIWAVYSDLDKFPKLYGWVREVEADPFKVHLTWLEACRQLEQEKQWLKKGVPVSCGRFHVRKWSAMYNTTEVFSHLVHARQTSAKYQFEILPQIGEVWAIYLNWSPDWVPSGRNHAEYAIGEVRRRTKSSTIFEFLTKVDGYVAVFKHDNQKAALKIPVKENLRFSHQIPSFRLTEENGGELCGFYELDPAAVPDVFLSDQGCSS